MQLEDDFEGFQSTDKHKDYITPVKKSDYQLLARYRVLSILVNRWQVCNKHLLYVIINGKNNEQNINKQPEHQSGFPLFWKEKIQQFSSPILQFSMCFRS